MRIFNKEERLNTSKKTINYFLSNEYNYYSTKNVYPFTLNGVEYKSLYRRLNVQLLVTKKCPFNCPFCIEKVNPVGNEYRNEQKQLESLEKVLTTLKASGMEPTVSITGGEPTLCKDFLLKVADLLDRLDVRFNLNTSGMITADKDKVIERFDRINLSVHSEDIEKNNSIFGVKRYDYWNNPIYKNATIQTVLTDNTLDSLIRFLNSFDQKRFSVRFPALTNADESLEWEDLFYLINKDSHFEFVQQKIGDYYWFEEYKYNEKTIRFSFASMKQLDYYKNILKEKENFARAFVILPSGEIQSDWIE